MSRTENLYGHRKKFLFVEDRLRRWRRANGRSPRVIDIGCGTGDVLTLPLAEHGYDVLGIDTHGPSVEIAQARVQVPTLHYRCCDIDEIHERFDVVILSEVLEHLDDPAALVKKARRVVEKNGILLITIPNGFGPFELEKAVWKALHMDAVWTGRVLPALKRVKSWVTLRTPRQGSPPTNSLDISPHVQFFTRQKLVSLLQECGWTLTAFEKGSFLAGPITDTFVPKIELLLKLNSSISSVLPAWAVSGWYFEFSSRPTTT
jgi:SAM-dependent methyltransferase